MKIYRVYEGKIHELEVRETKHTYKADAHAGQPFWCRRIFRKSRVAKSPEGAVDLALFETKQDIEDKKKDLHVLNSKLGRLQKLKNNNRF